MYSILVEIVLKINRKMYLITLMVRKSIILFTYLLTYEKLRQFIIN